MLNDCRKAFPILGKVTLCAYVPDFRKKIAHFGQGWLMCLKIAMKIEKVHVAT